MCFYCFGSVSDLHAEEYQSDSTFFSFMIQSVLAKSPTPLAEREPETMTEPLPYYIDSCRGCIILVSLPYNVKHLEVTAVVAWLKMSEKKETKNKQTVKTPFKRLDNYCSRPNYQRVWVFWNKTWRNEGWLDTVGTLCSEYYWAPQLALTGSEQALVVSVFILTQAPGKQIRAVA